MENLVSLNVVKTKTIFKTQMETKPEEVAKNLEKLEFTYSARIQAIVAKTCGGKRGKEFKKCLVERSDLASTIYSLEDYYSDNINISLNKDPSINKSIEILKTIFNEK